MSHKNNTKGNSRLVPTDIDPQDVDQQAELLKLQGKVPNRALLAKEMRHDAPELHFADWLPVTANEVKQEVVPMSASDYDILVEFLYSTPIDIDIINSFLDCPEDATALQNLLDKLYVYEITTMKQWNDTKPKAKSIRVLILEKITERTSMSKLEVIEYVSAIHLSKRPAEAARISIKRLIDSGKIKEVNGYYTATND